MKKLITSSIFTALLLINSCAESTIEQKKLSRNYDNTIYQEYQYSKSTNWSKKSLKTLAAPKKRK